MKEVPRVVLVGFMGAGKSTVGPLLARRLGYRFVDMDEEVERRAGASISEIFASGGEAAFRALEAEVTEALGEHAGLVVAAGGGWMARPELRDRWSDAVRIWLRVRPKTAVRRLEAGGGLASRPLLSSNADGHVPAGADRDAGPEVVARRLLASREVDYRRAELAIDTDGRTPEEVAEVAHGLLKRLVAGSAPPAYR